MSMPKLNAPAEIHWRRSNMNTRDPILMKSVEVLKDCRSLNAAAEMNCPMPRSVEKVPIRNEKRCSATNIPACGYFGVTTPFLIANRHLFTSDRQIALVSSAGIPLRQRSPHIDIVHLCKARGIENRHSAPC